MTFANLGLTVVVVAAIWRFGGAAARIGGVLAMVAGIVGLAAGLSPAAAVLIAGLGAFMWLLGQAHYAVRHQEYKSPLARYVLGFRPPGGLYLTRDCPPDRGAGANRKGGLTPSQSRATTSVTEQSKEEPMTATMTRNAPADDDLDPGLVHDFLLRALSHGALDDAVTELLFEHVVMGRYHWSVVAATLPLKIEEIVGVASAEDWRALAEALVIDGADDDARAMPKVDDEESRVSEQGIRFRADLIREFLWMAVTDPVAEARLNNLRERSLGRSGLTLHPRMIGQGLKSILTDAYRAGTEEDWNVIAGQLIAEATDVDREA